MTLRITLLTLGASLLACTGFGADSGSDTATSSTDTGSDGPEAGVHQTQSCRDYVACAESATPDDYSKLNKKYGESGSCWDSTTDKMHECDDECEAGIADLEEEFGTTCESTDTGGGDTGGDTGSDTGSSGSCPLDNGDWAFELDISDDGCGLGEVGNPWYGAVACEGDTFYLSLDMLGVSLPCSYSGRNFTCVVESDYLVLFDGTANSSGTSASGSFLFETGCTSNGSYTANKE